jgi:hypothetical protein
MATLSIRGDAVRELDLPLPPGRMPAWRRGRPLKRWRYVAVYSPELMLCVGDARVAGLPERWWAVALPDGSLREGAGRGPIELELEERDGVEVVSPHGRSYIWTRKQAGVHVSARVRLPAADRIEVSGPFGFVDDSAGYHARHTTWRWSAGIGRAVSGEAVAWNLVEGVHDAPTASERTVWVDGEPHEVGPQPFAPDLSAVGELRFDAWCEREDHTNRLLVRSDYRQPFGSFSGTLPGGLELESAHGVMEWHDVRW